jgi:hypothetical protein
MKPFTVYHNENPQIYKAFVEVAHQAKKKGFKNYSSKGIFELIRWHSAVSAKEHLKVNNNYHAYYARKMMQEFPEFDGFFRLRAVKASQTI